jgi:2-polyprenyl-3-methyl-5-hydroxy-6-metoxy-1,4-benzoquinol methylase
MTETKIERDCDFCGSPNKKFIKEENGYPISKCLECSLIYVIQIPQINDGKVLGEKNVDDRSEIETNRLRYLDVFKLLMDEVNQLRSKKGKLLDVGCGYGFFLVEAKQNNWEVFGTDLSEVAVEYVRNHHKIPQVFCTDLSDKTLSAQKFDVINMTNVLEHVPSPTEILNNCHKLLSNKGLLLIRVPNMNFYNIVKRIVFILKAVGVKNGGELTYLASPPPLHLIGFTPKTLEQYFKKTDLTTIEIKPSKLSSLSQETFLHKIVETTINLLYKISFGRINLSPTILAIAEKRM